LLLGIDLHDHAILVRLSVNRRDKALSEGVIERVIDGRGRDAETGGGGAVDDNVERQAFLLQVTGNVGELRELAELVDEPRYPGVEFF
jgi:hypothetical protein